MADPRLRAAVPPPPPPPPAEEPVINGHAADVQASEMTATTTTTTTTTAAAATPAEAAPDSGLPDFDPSSFKLKFCTVCAANQNRSMEAHQRLAAPPACFPVISFGTGSLVRLPGPTITQPNVYSFNSVSYAQIAEELAAKDPRLYRSNGVLPMLERNRTVKYGPERFQDWVPGMPRIANVGRGDDGAHGVEGGVVDVIITCEERCWDAVVDDLLGRGAPLNRPVHVFNVDIKDNHEEAMVGSKAILDLALRLNQAADEERRGAGGAAAAGWDAGTGDARRSFDERVPDILAEWQEAHPGLPALWTLSWF